jgi:phenylalanyl-tRNA synthetase alpha subunit
MSKKTVKLFSLNKLWRFRILGNLQTIEARPLSPVNNVFLIKNIKTLKDLHKQISEKVESLTKLSGDLNEVIKSTETENLAEFDLFSKEISDILKKFEENFATWDEYENLKIETLDLKKNHDDLAIVSDLSELSSQTANLKDMIKVRDSKTF